MALKTTQVTHQSTEQVNSLQNELLMSNPRNSKLLKLCMAYPQQPLPTHKSPFKHTNVLLQAVIKTYRKRSTKLVSRNYDIRKTKKGFLLAKLKISTIYLSTPKWGTLPTTIHPITIPFIIYSVITETQALLLWYHTIIL